MGVDSSFETSLRSNLTVGRIFKRWSPVSATPRWRNKKWAGDAFGEVGMMLSGAPAYLISFWFKSRLLYFNPSCSKCLLTTKQKVVNPVLESLPPTREIQVKLGAPGFGLLWASYWQHLGSEPASGSLNLYLFKEMEISFRNYSDGVRNCSKVHANCVFMGNLSRCPSWFYQGQLQVHFS